MVSGRIGSLSLVNDTLRDMATSQTKLAELQNQISSGYKSPNFAGLEGSVEKFTLVNSQLNRAKQYNDNNAVNIAKLQTVDVALDKITEIADQIKTNIVGANGAVVGTSNLPQIVSDLLFSMGAQLNTSFNGHYIFGGTDTVNPPVPTTQVNNAVMGVPDNNYYAGSNEDATLRVDEHTDMQFPARADNIAFQKIYAAAKQAIHAAETKDSEGLKAAQQLIQDGQRDLAALRSHVGTTVVNIQSIDTRLKDVAVHWKELSDSVSKTDIVEASAQVANYQASLQATFQVYSRLSQLRLSDYLK